MTEAPDALAKEFGERMFDPLWRISNLYTIIDKTGKKVPFKPKPEQLDFLSNMHNRNLILKARQIGFTTVCCIAYLDDCLFRPNIKAAVIAHKLDDAGLIFREKVRGVYNDLPEPLKRAIPVVRDNESTLEFANGSSIRVSNSTRSGTVQWLHISEYGKICSQFPDKAREIRTGAFPSAEQGVITIESTAEGNEGDFYEKCVEAETHIGKDLSRLDYKFFFYPWIGIKEYEIPQPVVGESPEDTAYFEKLQIDTGKVITQQQRHWWLAQERELGGDMKREYPATSREAFEQAIEGAYFADQIAHAYKQKRVGNFPIDQALPVHTAWDLGRNDDTVIWLFQDQGNLTTFVGYYRNSGEWIAHYVNWLEEWRKDKGVMFGRHYLPHDGDVKTIWVPGGSMEVMGNLGFRPDIVQRSPNKIEVINAARRKFAQCAFDEAACKDGLGFLKRYRKEWDERNGVWRNTPAHDDASHTADAFMTFTQSNHIAVPSTPDPRGADRYRRRHSTPSNSSWMAA
jgi:hypothetical protein